MGLFDKIKAAFDTGGIKVSLETHGKFAWGDPYIPTRVTIRGHESEPRVIEQLNFTLKDEGDNSGGPPGMRDRNARTEPDGRRVNLSWSFPLGVQLGPSESRFFDVAVPFSAGEGPNWLQSMQQDGAALSFGRIRWYNLAVHAPVAGVNAAKGTSVKLEAVRR